MFIKKPRSRPSLRARESDAPSSISSPLAQTSFTADDPDSSINVEDDDGDVSMGSILERKKGSKRDKERRRDRPSGGSRLSFGGDKSGAEGESSRPRKSLLSQSITANHASTSQSHSSPLGGSPSYSQDYLSQLKASTPSRAPRPVTVDDDEEDDGSGLSRLAREKYASMDSTEGIPDTAAIAAAKMKRQARLESSKHDVGQEEDFISLGGGKLVVHDGEDKGPHPESRLMREEDEGDEGDEDLAMYTEANDKLYLGKKAKSEAARRLRNEMGEMIEDREMEDDDDEEMREWEMAQVKRAGGWQSEEQEKPAKPSYQPTPMPSARPLPTVAPTQSRLVKSLADLNLTKSQNEHTLETTVRDLATLEEQEIDLRKEVERVEGKREWVEEFRGWVDMLGRFLEEKFPKLEDIEADSLHHLKERSDLYGKRRAEDDLDDLALVLGVAPPPADGPEEVDELGRTKPSGSEPQSGIRRARRTARESRRGKRKQHPTAEDDGFSTDSTLAEGDAEDYFAAQQHLEKRVVGLLDDVRAEDFRDPEKGVAVRFGDWRKRYEDEYVNAFGGLALVHAWEFWARGEMIGWEPLRSTRTLESFTWFKAIHEYCHPRTTDNGALDMDEDEDDEPPLGPEGDLIPEMVSRAVVPLLVKAFENGAYDPYSAPQTRRAVDLADVVSELTGKDSRKFTSFLKSVLMVYHNHIVELSTSVAQAGSPSAIPPPAFDPASRTSMERFVRRRLKLIKNILLWRRQSPNEVRELVNRLVTEVLRPVLERAWDGGGQDMVQKVIEVAGQMLSPEMTNSLRLGPLRRRY